MIWRPVLWGLELEKPRSVRLAFLVVSLLSTWCFLGSLLCFLGAMVDWSPGRFRCDSPVRSRRIVRSDPVRLWDAQLEELGLTSRKLSLQVSDLPVESNESNSLESQQTDGLWGSLQALDW